MYLKAKLAEVQQRNLENKLRSAEFYSARSAYDIGSKASVYWTPPTAMEGSSQFGSPAIRTSGPAAVVYRGGGDLDSGPQMSPIHINYINENLDTMIGLKPLNCSSKYLGTDGDAYGYALPPHLDRLRLYLCPERLFGGDGRLADDSGPSGLQKPAARNGGEWTSDDSEGSQTQKKNVSNEDNNCAACNRIDVNMDDDDDDADDPICGRGKKVTLRQFSTPHERASLLVAGGGLSHSASCHLCPSVSNGGSARKSSTKRFGNEYYHSVENVTGDEDTPNNFNHTHHQHNHAAIVLPTVHQHKSSAASKSPSCRCCPSTTASIPSTHSSTAIAHPLQPQHSCEINDFVLGGGTTHGKGCDSSGGGGGGGRATVGGDKLNIILDETGKPMLVNQCDNRLLLLQTSASLPEMQTVRSMVVANNGAAPTMMMPQQHHTTVEVHDGRHDVVLAIDGGDSDGGGCKDVGSVGCLPKAARHEDASV